MFDGHKIVVGGVLFTIWAQNPLLDFALKVSKQSGEVLGEDERAQYKGLDLVVKSSKVDVSGHRIEVHGSLPNFLNDGQPTAAQMTMVGISRTLAKLQQELGIDANEAVLLNAEICINVFCPSGVAKVLNAIKGHFNNGSVRRDDEPKFKGVKFERTQYTLKIYDKSLHIGEAWRNILRVELKLNKSEILQKHDIKYLADLQNAAKVEPLIKLLIEKLQDVIMIDPLNCDTLNEKDRLQLQAWANTDYWKSNFPLREHKDKKQRERARFENIIHGYGLDSIKQNLMKSLCEVWTESMESKEVFLKQDLTQSKKIRSTSHRDTLTIKIKCQSVAKNIYNSLIVREKSILPKSGKSGKNQAVNDVKTGRVCVVCGGDISMKIQAAKVCSKKCSNLKTGSIRTQKERNKRAIEQTVLDYILSKSVTSKIIHLAYRNGGRDFEKITKSQYRDFGKAQIKRVHLLRVKVERKDYVLSRQRARRLLLHLIGESHEKQ